MLCESAEKFGGGNGGLLWFIRFGVGAPTVGDGARDGVVGEDALWGDGDSIDVGAEIFQEPLWSCEWWFDADDPWPFHGSIKGRAKTNEGGEFGKCLMRPVLKSPFLIGFQQQSSQSVLKCGAQKIFRQEECFALSAEAFGGYPAFLFGVPSAGGDDQVDMRMPAKIASPRMEHRHLSDFGAQIAGIAAEVIDGITGGLQQHSEHYCWKCGRYSAQIGRRGKDAVIIVARQ